MPTAEGGSSARGQPRHLQRILSVGAACVIPFLTEFSSIPLQAAGGGLWGPWRQGSSFHEGSMCKLRW